MKRIWVFLGATAFVAGCATVAATDFNGDSVTIQSSLSQPDEEVVAEAQRICGSVNRRAEYASSRELYAPQYLAAYGHLYLCLPN